MKQEAKKTWSYRDIDPAMIDELNKQEKRHDDMPTEQLPLYDPAEEYRYRNELPEKKPGWDTKKK